jgi:hypothetical protein
MHACAECDKTLATAGGLEVHMEMAHGVGAAEPDVEEVGLEEAIAVLDRPERAPVVDDDENVVDATVPLAVVLVVLLFLGSVAALVTG